MSIYFRRYLAFSYIAVIACASVVAACTTADQERIATTIAEDEEVQDRLIEVGDILETREAEYTPTPLALHEIEATTVESTAMAEEFIERTCDHWENAAGRMLDDAEASILSSLFNHLTDASKTPEPPAWEDVSWHGFTEPEFECPDYVATVAPHVTATAAVAHVIATAYVQECGDDPDEMPIRCLTGWEYDPERREREATGTAEALSREATIEADLNAFNATAVVAAREHAATMTAMEEAATASATAEATAAAP